MGRDSSNERFAEIVAARLSRPTVLTGGLVTAGATFLAPALPRGRATAQSGLLGFSAIALSTADTVAVPPGYTVQILYAWGDPISSGPAFKPDASNTAEDQMLQA